MIPRSYFTFAEAINRWWGIVGTYCMNPENADCHSFLYGPAGFQQIDVPGATFTEVRGLNDAWQICGSYGDAQGVSHLFIGEPVSTQATR
jgi:hypothetical protein